MRTAFIRTLETLAASDDRIWLVCGDLGYSVLEDFAAAFPNRYVNAGVAEQNMTGIAAGLAASGKIVFTYSIANFPVIRCLEQIRNDVCYHNLNVNIVAVGGGLAYGSQGYTHHGVEDLGIMRLLPNMRVFAPGDPTEVRLVTQALVAEPGPSYLRLGKAGEEKVHQSDPHFSIGSPIVLRDGDDCAIFSTGSMLATALRAGHLLNGDGHSTLIASFPTLSPFDCEFVSRVAKRVRGIITVEEHGPGGLGTLTAEVLGGEDGSFRLKTLCLPRQPVKTAGSQEVLRAQLGLDTEAVSTAARSLLRGASPTPANDGNVACGVMVLSPTGLP